MRLTNGEGWWLLRRRLGKTMAEMAAEHGISEDRLRDWERGRVEAPSPGRCHTWPRLTPGEYNAIARRRSGWTLPDVALWFASSRQTAWKAEHDQTSSAKTLARCWAGAYPRPGLPAPLRIQSPALGPYRDG